MGALHQGHLSLVDESMRKCDQTICSIFVNPTQFNNPEDLANYPRTLNQDLEKLAHCGVHAAYIPTVDGIYGPSPQPDAPFDLGNLENDLEGHFRPGHFQGVISVVRRLFRQVQPTDVFFGAKDFQQCMVVKRLMDAEFPTLKMHVCETKREHDGLAMSSRNMRLSGADRLTAATLGRSLLDAQKLSWGSAHDACEWVTHRLNAQQGIRVEYVAMRSANSFDQAPPAPKPWVLLVAAYVDGIRLIDNIQLR